MKNFLFIRHGPIKEDFQKVFYGQLDVPLSEEGKIKSIKTVSELSSLPFEIIYSSPLQRALFPAQELAKITKVPLIICEELKEINYGTWTGKEREIIYKEPLYWERLKRDDLSPPGGESIRDLRKRARSFFETLKDLKNGLYAIFTHGGFIRALICELLELESKFFFTFEVYHLKGLLLTLFEDGAYVIKGLNLDPAQVNDLLKSSYW